MTLRSKLFATVAAPVFSAAVMVDPVAAASVMRSQQAVSPVSSRMLGSIELAQAAVTCSDGSQAADQASCDAIDAQFLNTLENRLEGFAIGMNIGQQRYTHQHSPTVPLDRPTWRRVPDFLRRALSISCACAPVHAEWTATTRFAKF